MGQDVQHAHRPDPDAPGHRDVDGVRVLPGRAGRPEVHSEDPVPARRHQDLLGPRISRVPRQLRHTVDQDRRDRQAIRVVAHAEGRAGPAHDVADPHRRHVRPLVVNPRDPLSERGLVSVDPPGRVDHERRDRPGRRLDRVGDGQRQRLAFEAEGHPTLDDPAHDHESQVVVHAVDDERDLRVAADRLRVCEQVREVDPDVPQRDGERASGRSSGPEADGQVDQRLGVEDRPVVEHLPGPPRRRTHGLGRGPDRAVAQHDRHDHPHRRQVGVATAEGQPVRVDGPARTQRSAVEPADHHSTSAKVTSTSPAVRHSPRLSRYHAASAIDEFDVQRP